MWEFNEEVKYIQAMLCSCLLFFFRGGGGRGGEGELSSLKYNFL